MLVKQFKFTLAILLLFPNTLMSQVNVDECYQPQDGKNWAPAINRAMHILDSIGHGSLEFTGTLVYYVASSCQLPKYGAVSDIRCTIILNGNGCKIVAPDSVDIFTRQPTNQKEALNKYMHVRMVINDFTFEGGRRAINLCATYGSSINRCNFIAPRLAAIDVQFGLNTSISQCIVTNAYHDNFILRCGTAWGGSEINSQSNHSVIDMCRVYARKGSNSCFKIIGSNGCVISNCISEGSNDINYSIYYDFHFSTCVRLFKIENLHLEHKPVKAAIYLRSTGIVTIDGVYYQKAYQDFPLIYAADKCDQINVINIPYYVPGTALYQEKASLGAFWKIENCIADFYKSDNWRIGNGKGGWKKELPAFFSGMGYRKDINTKFGQ